MRSSCCSLLASKRAVSAGPVLDARSRPQPSAKSTRKPSSLLSFPFGKFARAMKRSISANFSSSGTGTRISAVLTAWGKSAMASSRLRSCDDRISARRPVAYRPSSKPNQRSPKKIWPENSPPSSAPVSSILAFISAWPVLHSTGRPPRPVTSWARLRLHFTS